MQIPNQISMKTSLLVSVLSLVAFCLPKSNTAQCNTSNATSCICDDGSSDCDLLPDITISWYALENVSLNETPGRLYVSGSTPNIGHGPFTVRGVDMAGDTWFECGTDTFSTSSPGSFTCPGGETPRQIVWQRIYHKNGSTMSDYLRMASVSMTFHPSHGHNHFDNWGIFSLRMEDSAEPDPRKWPIVAEGHKLGFCLMDYYSCTSGSALHHCKDDNTVYNAGTTLNSTGDFDNYGLGGGGYGCSMTEEGISAGYTDLYGSWLDGMWIDIPPTVCNGDYWIVYEVDPDDAILEEDETNNYTAIPITLTNQSSSGPASATVRADGDNVVCAGETVTLTANGGTSYLWNTGATTPSITVGAGTYDVQVSTYCGTTTSGQVTVTELPIPADPTTTGDLVCVGQTATISATGSNIVWYDDSGNEVGTGNTFITPALTSSTTYYAADETVVPGATANVGLYDNSAGGSDHAGGQALIFDAYIPFTLKSVKVFAGSAGYRTFDLVDQVEALRASTTIYVPAGESRVTLDWDIPVGNDMEITTNGFTELFRNNAGVSYPYTLTDTMSITGSTAGAGWYYYFYDWELEFGGGMCGSNQVSALAAVQVCSAVDDIDLAESIFVFPNPTSGSFQVDLVIEGTDRIEMTMTDLAGRVLHAEAIEPGNGMYTKQIDVGDVPTGVYILTFNIADKLYYKKLAIE